jgi:hypothetical protein
MAVETITTVLVPAGSYDLTDLATVKDELSIPTGDTTQDAFLGRALSQASKVIANFCNRTFAVEIIQDLLFIEQDAYPFQVPGGVDPLQLARWPLTDSSVVAFTGDTHGTTTIDNIASTAGLSAGQLVFGTGIVSGTTFASVGVGTVTLSKAATASAAGVAFTTGVRVVQNRLIGTSQTLVFGTDFVIDAERGWLIRLNPFTGGSTGWEAEPTTVQYRAGYASIPFDLVDACLRLVTARFKMRGRDPMLRSEGEPGLGQLNYWVGTMPGQDGSLAPEIAGLLDSYRTPVIG